MLWSKFPSRSGDWTHALLCIPNREDRDPFFFCRVRKNFAKFRWQTSLKKMTDFRQVSVFSGNHLKCPAAQTKFSGSPGEMFILVRREASADPIRMDLTFGNSKFVAFPCLILRRGCTRTFFGVYFSVEQFSTFSEGSFSADAREKMKK